MITKNEIEALMLENTLIKKHKPKYNISLRDSKSYAYIDLTKEKYPRFLISRLHTKNTYRFGPFTSARARDDILQVINKAFKLRTCRKLPKKACLRHAINLCSAPCIKAISEEDYNEDVNSAKKVLKGKSADVIKMLKEKMQKASKKQDFERALQYRSQINSLDYLNEQQNVIRDKKYNEDIINYIVKKGKVYLLIFNIYRGTLENKQEFIFEERENFLEDFLAQYYSETTIPKDKQAKYIIIPKQVSPIIAKYLTHKYKTKVETIVPKIGEKKALLDLVEKNIEIAFFAETEKLEILQNRLNLQELPIVMECFDISHLSGTHIVASMVQFRNGKPDKSNYRRFKMKTVFQNDDFASMEEVVKRRYTKLKNENLSLPNLIIIDGGIGQLNAALKALDSLNLKIPIISLAKQFEEIFVPGSSEAIRLSDKNKGRLLLQQIRDEAHRFAITYNRLLRKKSLFNK
ncbi:MAG: excinuclease ABC subunit C [Patescibacteria group bacterium]|jgi:excinuclease ABC subunit C